MKNKKTLMFYIGMVILIVAVTGLFIMGESQIKSQKAQLASLAQTIKSNNQQISTLAQKNASQSAQIKELLTQPTPVIETQYISQPSSQNNAPSVIPTPTLTLEEAIVQNVVNSYEHPQPQPEVIQEPAKPTFSHCTSDLMGGMNCTSE